MKDVVQCAPSNSLVLINGGFNSKIPLSMDGKGISATPSCIAVGTLMEFDGKTNITLTDEIGGLQENKELRAVYTGQLETPERELLIETVHGEVILKTPTKNSRVNIVLFANHDTEPDQIVIFVQD